MTVRPEGGEGGKRLGKIISHWVLNRLGVINNKPPKAAAETRTGKQQWIYIPNNSNYLWYYLHISCYCRVYQHSNPGLCPWSKKDPHLGENDPYIWKSVRNGGTESSQTHVHTGSDIEMDTGFDLRPWRRLADLEKQSYTDMKQECGFVV